MNKATKSTKSSSKTQQLIVCSKKQNKRHENSNTFLQTSSKNTSDEEYYNFSDSSLELFDSFKPRPLKKNVRKKVKSGVVIDEIDLITDTYTESKFTKKSNSSNNVGTSIYNSVCDSDTSSNESYKSTKSVLSDSNNVINRGSCNSPVKKMYSKYISKSEHDEINVEGNNLSKFQNNYSTPKKTNFPTKQLTESAKILDRLYGKEWRRIDGVIKNVNINKLNDDFFASDSDNEDIENSFPSKIQRNKCLPNKDIEIAVKDTSFILENISLSNNSDQENFESLSPQCNTYDCKNVVSKKVKQITKHKTSKKDGNLEKKDKLSKIPIKASTEAKLSFLSSLSYFTGSLKCDPEADKYKFKFNKNKDELVAVLFKMFNEEVFDNKLPTNMNFKWNARLRKTAGACFNKRTVKISEKLDCERISRIEFSSKIIDTAERLRDTLIHELCHAACWIFNGVSEGHGPSWKSWANKAMEKYPELPIIKRCHSYDIQTKFTYKCVKCGYSFGRHSKSLNLAKKRCGYCYGEFELIVNKINKNPLANSNLPVAYKDPLTELYSLNNEPTKTKLPKKPSKFALFVKENYGRVKKENPSAKHGEVMKLLGSKFATTKTLTPDEAFDQLFDS